MRGLLTHTPSDQHYIYLPKEMISKMYEMNQLFAYFNQKGVATTKSFMSASTFISY